MKKKILVITPTLGNRDTLKKTINSVFSIGKDDVRHVLVAPKERIKDIQSKYHNVECIEEPTDGKGIYHALNYVIDLLGMDYEYMTFINDDDCWLPDFRLLIDAVLTDSSIDFVYGKVVYHNEHDVKIGTQTCSRRFKSFISLLKQNIILLTQQSTIVRTSLFLSTGAFDESYKLIADTKFWALLSQKDINFKYINRECAVYCIQQGQLSSDKSLQKAEHVRLLSEFYDSNHNVLDKIMFRTENLSIYIRRFLRCKGNVRKPRADASYES